MKWILRIVYGTALLTTAWAGNAWSALPDYQVKAAFIINIAQFTEWPNPADSTFKLCVLGDDAISAALLTIPNRTVSSKPVELIITNAPRSDCRAAYVGLTDPTTRRKWLEAFEQQSTLTFTDGEMVDNTGGVIGLATINSRVVFTVQLAKAKTASLNISAKVLRLAYRVDDQ